MSDRTEATVKWFDCVKGFGFAKPDIEGDDVFVHISAVRERTDLAQGDKISYVLQPGRGGRMQAGQVELIEDD